jgi:hypothetical protein
MATRTTLSDFPNGRVHIAAEELAAINAGHWRYREPQFTHGVHWREYTAGQRTWHGLKARPVPVELDDAWLLHVGDAYYLRLELTSDHHPVSQLAAQRAVDDAQRRKASKSSVACVAMTQNGLR